MSKVLTIQRSKWRRGGDMTAYKGASIGAGSTRLLNNEGFMCCLGFDALACGLTETQIQNAHYPSTLVNLGRVAKDSEYAKTRVSVSPNGIPDDAPAAAAAANANDDRDLTEATRELAVRAHLIALGWDDVVFVD